jgi:hypothetical protein
VLREQITGFADTVLDELERAHGEGFADDVAQILGPLVDRHDYSLGLGPLIDQTERAANTQPDEIATLLLDFAQYLREEQHVPPGPAVAPEAPAAVAPEALGVFEPEAPHPAGPGGAQEVAHHLLEIERRPDGTLSTEGLESTAFALYHGQLDYPGYTQIPPGLERARAMRPVFEAFTTAMENERAIQRMQAATYAPPAPAPAPPALLQGRATNLVEAYLQNLQGQFGDTFAELVRDAVMPIVQNMNGIGDAEHLAHRIEFAGLSTHSISYNTTIVQSQF